MVKKKNKKIIVIGSNSFSAGSLIKLLLKKGYQVIGVGRSKINKNHFLAFNNNSTNFKFRKLDINKDHKKIFFLLKKTKPQYIINLLLKVWLDKAGITQSIGFVQILLV